MDSPFGTLDENYRTQVAQAIPILAPQVIDFSQCEIEHVYPRNATSKDPVMEPLKNRLGNLSFWAPSDNTKAANQSFAAKKKLFAESKVLLNRELAKYSKFGDKQLQDREDELVKRGLGIFRM